MVNTGEPADFTQAGFHTTQWNLVLASGQDDSIPGADNALDDLCRSYWSPLYAFARRRGKTPHDAQDAVQGFFLHFIETRAFARADPQRGRFRSFLLGSFTRFMASEWEHGHAQKRGGNREIISLDLNLIEAGGLPELSTAATPERAFEERWALTVVERAMAQLSAEAEARGKSAAFAAARPFLTSQGNVAAYQEIAATLGLGAGAWKTLIHRLRREFGTLLRREVARTLSDPTEVDDELRHLRGVLAEILP
jgi:RNA polymerase sigma factor (sigma-70 family)